MQQPVVIARDEAFRENGQGKSCLGQNAGGAFERFAIQALAIDAESPDAWQQEGLHAVLHEEMPTGHDVERPGDLAREQSQNHGIAGAAVIGGQQHAGPGIQGSDQTLRAHAFPGSDAEALAKIRWQIPLDDSRPERAEARRHEPIGLGDDNVLHGELGRL